MRTLQSKRAFFSGQRRCRQEVPQRQAVISRVGLGGLMGCAETWCHTPHLGALQRHLRILASAPINVCVSLSFVASTVFVDRQHMRLVGIAGLPEHISLVYAMRLKVLRPWHVSAGDALLAVPHKFVGEGGGMTISSLDGAPVCEVVFQLAWSCLLLRLQDTQSKC